MKTRYFIKLSFKGTHYHGWQIQPNASTVQQILNEDFSLLLGGKVRVTGCGRTDTGVHARVFYAHVDGGEKLAEDQDFIFKINNKLPADIAIHKILPVRAGAHARFDALSRTYEYHIHRRKEVFNTDLAHYIYGELDFASMQAASDILKDYTDFTSFSKVDTDTKTNNCKIHLARWDITEDTMLFTIQADRFLRNMVRAIVGTLLDVGFRRIDPDGFRHIIENRNRSEAGTSAPARGLFLTDVQYAPEIFI
ncbi:MAG: tRNA pseudouridine(38-40) synthase TruA [Bacteroidales bacterium]|nr:tRNA pseudouridine(38-40) synthase TruA [Bacteroidales bacterium]